MHTCGLRLPRNKTDMEKEIRIEKQGEELHLSFWVNDEKVPFDQLDKEEQGDFAQMIRCFSHYFLDIEAMADTQVFIPN